MSYTWHKFFHNYFIFSKFQRIGFFLLVILNFLSFVLLGLFIENQVFIKTNTIFIEKKIKLFYSQLKKIEKQSHLSRLDRYILARYDTLQLFKFNPNTATEQDFKRLGLTDKQIATIIRYRKNGGKFIVKEDFKKIYGIRPRQYFILEPYIDLPEHKKKPSALFYFDPNTVSEKQLLQLGFNPVQAKKFIESRNKGWKFYTKKDFKKHFAISEFLYKKLEPYIRIDLTNLIPEINTAKYYDILFFVKNKKITSRIINYRNKLGGFYSIDQLKEVYGMTDTMYDRIKNYFIINVSAVKKINLNTADFNTLKSHPYIRYKKAKLIIEERKQKPFLSEKDLKLRELFTEYEFEKILPYLDF